MRTQWMVSCSLLSNIYYRGIYSAIVTQMRLSLILELNKGGNYYAQLILAVD